MKKKSVKTRITCLLTLLMATMAILLLGFMVIISNTIATQTVRHQLLETLRSNIAFVEATDKKPIIEDNFSYYHNGVTTLIYSQNESLLAGQIPVSFKAEAPFENGVIQTVEAEDTAYLVLDFWIAADWDNGIWLRGLVEAPNNEALTRNLLIIALIAI